jgi:hypothetical protein
LDRSGGSGMKRREARREGREMGFPSISIGACAP